MALLTPPILFPSRPSEAGKVPPVAKWRVVLALALVAGGTTAVSCGGGSDGNPYMDFVAAYCDLFTPCCAANAYATDGKLCRLLGTVSPPPGFQKTAGDACLNDLRVASATADFCKTGDSQITSCQTAFGHHLDKAPGQACSANSDCAPSAEGSVICTYSPGTTPRTICQIRIAGVENDTPCLGTIGGDVPFEPSLSSVTPGRGFLCDVGDGLRCDGTACVRLKPVGAPCTIVVRECAATAVCDSATSTCIARKNAGDACGSNSYECALGTTCGFDRSCVTKGGIGAPCQIEVECLSGNCRGGVCVETDNVGWLLVCGQPG